MAIATENMIDQIGDTAGKIWHCLSSNGTMSISKLVKTMDEPRDRIMQGIGWLARENKIQIVERKRIKTVSLVPEEAGKVA